MLGEVVLELGPPLLGVQSPAGAFGVELRQLLPRVASGELDPAEHRVAHQHGERPLVGGDPLRLGREYVGRGLVPDPVGAAQLLPLVEQAGVDLAHHLAQPLDDVPQLIALQVLRDGLLQRLVRPISDARCLLFSRSIHFFTRL